jgi:hypothetical protein
LAILACSAHPVCLAGALRHRELRLAVAIEALCGHGRAGGGRHEVLRPQVDTEGVSGFERDVTRLGHDGAEEFEIIGERLFTLIARPH